jgi:hypothetical protein
VEVSQLQDSFSWLMNIDQITLFSCHLIIYLLLGASRAEKKRMAILEGNRLYSLVEFRFLVYVTEINAQHLFL